MDHSSEALIELESIEVCSEFPAKGGILTQEQAGRHGTQQDLGYRGASGKFRVKTGILGSKIHAQVYQETYLGAIPPYEPATISFALGLTGGSHLSHR